MLGIEHPSTLTTINNLAIVLKDQGKYKEAEQRFGEVLVIRQKVLGIEHPLVLVDMYNLAEMLRH